MINKKFTIPTGYLFTSNCSKGELETLSIGDYGKRFNVKADFLGFKNNIEGVPNTHCMPLSEKWVITVSTQYGCPMKCTFCFPAGTKIRTPSGECNIEDCDVGESVMSDFGCQSKISKLFQNEYNGDLICIEMENGVVLKCTPEHPIAVNKGEGITWVLAKDLQESDELIEYMQ